jgi:hypothetical protein
LKKGGEIMKEITPSDKAFGDNLKKLRIKKFSNGRDLAIRIGIKGKKGTTYYLREHKIFSAFILKCASESN